MNTALFIILFLLFFFMALIGAYMKGYESGKKNMMKYLIEKKAISSELLTALLKTFYLKEN